ncbi:MAG TPA: hypothetical protein VI911_10895 [Patescibacteria group bacterium]|nr:hypothetical protein [Patescibacteria group bacterium]
MRSSWFYRGWWFTHKWKKDENGKWNEYYIKTEDNPTIPWEKHVSPCIGCEFYVGAKMKECQINQEKNLENMLTLKGWSEDEQDRIVSDYRTNWTPGTFCPYLKEEGQQEPKQKPTIISEKEFDDDVAKQLAFFDYETTKPIIEKIVNAFDNRKEFDTVRLVDAIDKIKVDDFKRYLMDTNKKILSGYDGNLHIVECKRPVKDKDCYESLLHIRDIIRLSERTLRNAEFGTVTGYIKYLEKIDSPDFIPDGRNDYTTIKEWSYGSDNDDGVVTEDQISDLIEHFTGVGAERSAKQQTE